MWLGLKSSAELISITSKQQNKKIAKHITYNMSYQDKCEKIIQEATVGSEIVDFSNGRIIQLNATDNDVDPTFNQITYRLGI